jgi:hypothetical protein
MALATLVDLRALVEVALVSLLATVAAVAAFSTAVLCTDRFRGAQGRGARVAPAWLLALVLAAVACVAIVVYAIAAMTHK